MARGKQTCRILKEIRRQIAEANDIEFATSECRYKGDCLGTCPKCEAEVRFLEQQLRARSLAGKAVALAGISAASLAMLMPMTSQAQKPAETKALPVDNIVTSRVDSVMVKGVVYMEYIGNDGSMSTDRVIGAVVKNLSNGKDTTTDIDGKFEIEACPGDSIRGSFVGYHPETVCVKSATDSLQIHLTEDKSVLLGEVVTVGAIYTHDKTHYLDLNVTDEKGNTIDPKDFYVERIWLDEEGDEDSEYISTEYLDDEHLCRIYWHSLQDDEGNPLKEATLRIQAKDYDEPVTIKVKSSKRITKKNVKFKHKKKY